VLTIVLTIRWASANAVCFLRHSSSRNRKTEFKRNRNVITEFAFRAIFASLDRVAGDLPEFSAFKK